MPEPGSPPLVRIHLTRSALDAAIAVLVVRGINARLIHQLEQAADEISAQEEEAVNACTRSNSTAP